MMKSFAVFAALAFLSVAAWAEDIFIVDSRRNIPLSDDEPVYKDFYLNAGEGSELKKNLVVTAVRKLPIRDAAGAHSYGEIEVPVGQLRILALSGKVAVAREYKLLSRDEHPMLEQIGIMNGDRIDLKGSFTDNKPAKKVSAVPPAVTPVAPATPAEPIPATATAQPSVTPPLTPATPATDDARAAASVSPAISPVPPSSEQK